MKLAAVYACIYVISSNVAQMPLHVMRRTGKKVDILRFIWFMTNQTPGRPAISGESSNSGTFWAGGMVSRG
ncbi:hypothetical protein D1K51_16605 [Salmonella enterica]|nr:hypothetical protein [Salmonella enterica]